MDSGRCPECGSEVSRNAPGGLCPRCLLRQGLEGPSDFPLDASTREEPPIPDTTPGRIGHYRLLQVLGEGGMGRVYLAEQTEPIRRRVALKVIKLGMDTRQVIARFEAERQALALMDHPSIAQVYDAGVTEQGSPYFAMEYVKGEPVTTYCDRHRLPMRERLELFRKVCDGVQHAHHKAVIHRDLKASNVLVTLVDGVPVPKIIDFGVAKAISSRLTERTLFTEIGALVGTPEYMSPEQAAATGLDVDTRTDVYSLGVLLYELLTGTLPFDSREMRAGGYDEIRRRIREFEPSRPSARLSTIATADKVAHSRRMDRRTLRRRLRGDLDWIVMRALEKDRTRRYGSPAELAADVARHLDHEPVAARRPSPAYRLGKAVRRHKVGAAMTATLAAVLVMAMVVTSVGMVRARRAERVALEAQGEARREADTATQVTEFLVGLFEEADPGQTRGREVTVGEVLDRGSARIRTELAGQPIVQARLLQAMGWVYFSLGAHQEARGLLESAREAQGELLGRSHHDTVVSAQQLAVVLWEMGAREESLGVAGATLETLERSRSLTDPQLLTTKRDLGMSYTEAGRYDEAGPLLEEALRGFRQLQGEDGVDTLTAQNNLALFFSTVGRFDESIALSLDTLERRRELYGSDHPHTLDIMSILAIAYQNSGRPGEAVPYLIEAAEVSQRVLGPDHPRTLGHKNNLAVLHRDLGQLVEAEQLLSGVLESCRRRLGDDHPNTLLTRGNLGEIYTMQGRYTEAERQLGPAVEGLRRVIPGAHVAKGFTIRKLGVCLTRQGRFGEARSALTNAHAMLVDTVGAEHPQTLKAVLNLAELYEAWGEPEKTAEWRSRLPEEKSRE